MSIADQEDERGVADEGDGHGQLALVPSAVGASWLVCILSELQLLQGPLHHLRERERERQRERENERD